MATGIRVLFNDFRGPWRSWRAEIHQPHHENRKQTSGQGTCREGQRSQLASREWVRMARLAVVVVVVVLVLAAAAGRPDYTLSQKFIEMLQSEQSAWKIVLRCGETDQGKRRKRKRKRRRRRRKRRKEEV
ncbi:uncharacterized protein LOC123502472 isoform X2 [Portunus trituberculatus]|uniref:uncharacterized protein LOC123502472 isoform X2 n=1 Tax=Portunus trituberculatus TaxID=210409 RepID=UPI001E1CFD66|nr:uncharacterized protein LOC123502472 isoform X2 [Portunus trituberculatus]